MKCKYCGMRESKYGFNHSSDCPLFSDKNFKIFVINSLIKLKERDEK